jgi:hypothetical protein
MIKLNLQLHGWDEVEDNETTNIDFTKFPEGNTVIRIIDEKPHTRWTHWVPQANEGKGSSVTCIGKGCPICELISHAKANKEKPKYNSRKVHAMRIINRTTGKVEINEQGKTFYQNLNNIRKEIGDLRCFDVKVIRKGTSKSDTTYTLLPLAPSGKFETVEGKYKFIDFDEKDKKLVDKNFNFDDFYVKPDVDTILKIIDGKPFSEIFGEKKDDNNDEEDDIDVDFTK